MVHVLALRRTELHVIPPGRFNGRAGFPHPALSLLALFRRAGGLGLTQGQPSPDSVERPKLAFSFLTAQASCSLFDASRSSF